MVFVVAQSVQESQSLVGILSFLDFVLVLFSLREIYGHWPRLSSVLLDVGRAFGDN